MKEIFDDSNKKNPFEVPEGYFDSLEDRIMDRISSEKEDTREIQLRPWVAYAAAAAIALLVIFFLIPNSDEANNSPEQILTEVSTEAIVEYLAYTEITSSEILDQAQFTNIDADSLQWNNSLDLEPDEIDLLIEEYSLIELDSNSL